MLPYPHKENSGTSSYFNRILYALSYSDFSSTISTSSCLSSAFTSPSLLYYGYFKESNDPNNER